MATAKIEAEIFEIMFSSAYKYFKRQFGFVKLLHSIAVEEFSFEWLVVPKYVSTYVIVRFFADYLLYIIIFFITPEMDSFIGTLKIMNTPFLYLCLCRFLYRTCCHL